jgi:enoyl-CoA hydratase
LVSSEFIKYEEENQIDILTINRPKALNALNSKVLEELDSTLDSTNTSNIRVLIITGAGDKSFVAGADISEMSKLSKKQGEEFSKKGNDVFRKIETCEIPVIAAINGYDLGGGCENLL